MFDVGDVTGYLMRQAIREPLLSPRLASAIDTLEVSDGGEPTRPGRDVVAQVVGNGMALLP